MAKTAKMGRASIFRGKEDGYRVQAIITKVGGKKFEQQRSALGNLCKSVTGERPTTISDADVVEFMARGVAGTEEYLQLSERRK